MSGNRNTSVTLPTPVEPMTDDSGQVSMAWRGWFQQIQRRWSSGQGGPPVTTDPTKWPLAGSLYSRTDGTAAAGNLLFMADGTGGWHPIATTDSPVFTGDPQAPTPPPGDNDTSLATTAFVTAAIASGGGLYVLIAGSTMTGALTAPKLTAPQVFAQEFILNGAVVWISGTGAPTVSVVSAGSLYSRTDGGVGSSLYVCQGGATWAAVA